MQERWTRGLAVALHVVAVVSALSTLGFVALAFLRAPHTPVAAEIAYEALRVARGLPLYVDPWQGAWEDGAPPARYFVLYTPLFPLLVGKLSPPSLDAIRIVGRTLSGLCWITIHVAPVAFARRENRRATALAAMLAASIFFVARHATSMSPDALATVLVCIAVLRAARADRLDALGAALLVAAPLVKPSCLGGAAGMTLAHLLVRRPGWLRTTLGGLGAATALLVVCHVASGGAWIANLTRSTGQPLTFARFVQEFGARAMVLGLPHAAVLVVAARRRTSWFAVLPLACSVAWTTFMMAKHGSGSHYWLEPTGLALVAIGQTELRRPRAELAAALVFGGLVLATGLPSYLREPARYRRVASAFERIDRHCVRAPGEFVMSTDYLLELTLNGRIAVPAWQSGFLARTGRFPLEAWREDLLRPEVRWLALGVDPEHPKDATNDDRVERSVYYDLLRDAVLDHYALSAVIEDQRIYRRIR